MACDIESLLTDACTNEFLKIAQNETQSRYLILQLFYQATGGTETFEELWAQVCTNNFDKVAQNETQFRYVLLQLLCDSGG